MKTWYSPARAKNLRKFLKIIFPFRSEFENWLQDHIFIPYNIVYEIHGNITFSKDVSSVSFKKEHGSRASWLFNLIQSKEMDNLKRFLSKRRGDFFNLDLVMRAKVKKSRIGPAEHYIIKPMHSLNEARISQIMSRDKGGFGPKIYSPKGRSKLSIKFTPKVPKQYCTLIVEEDATRQHAELWRTSVHNRLKVRSKAIRTGKLTTETKDFLYVLGQIIRFIHDNGYCYGDRILPHLYYNTTKKSAILIDYGGTFKAKKKEDKELDFTSLKKDLEYYLIPDKAPAGQRRKMSKEIWKFLEESYAIPIF